MSLYPRLSSNLEDQALHLSDAYNLTRLSWTALLGASSSANIAVLFIGDNKPALQLQNKVVGGDIWT
jgi:hypothetical protein